MPIPADGYMPDGTPVYLKCARGSGKSTLQLEIYRQLCGIPSDEWEQIQKEVERKLYGFQNEDSQD